jgi:hypothetical protein
MRLIKVIPFKQKSEWQLVTKYNIGRSKKGDESGQSDQGE